MRKYNTMPGRANMTPENSSQIDEFVRDSLGELIRVLIEERGLYQNVRIEETEFERFKTLSFSDDDIVRLYKSKPIEPVSRGAANSIMERRAASARGGMGLGTPNNKIPIEFDLPDVELHCKKCRRNKHHLSLLSSGLPKFAHPDVIANSGEREQAIPLYYQCGTCRTGALSFMVLRRGLKMQLVGRCTPFRPKIDATWPSETQPIVANYIAASMEGDVPAGYYHLRTAIEHQMKLDLGLAVGGKMEGVELCNKYKQTLDSRMNQGIPSLGPIYTQLSAGMHARSEDREGLAALYDQIVVHFKARDLYANIAAGD